PRNWLPPNREALCGNLIVAVNRPEHMAIAHARHHSFQAPITFFDQAGIGTVRTRQCFPTRSTMHKRLSRCWTCFTVRLVSVTKSESEEFSLKKRRRLAR
ncbi:MAG TPA: hypothetical protein VNH18_28150, partial [Bryobacteraceae bacterium]|nr:hypothetical protein [Bryobacteraceae bacterium]